MFRLAIVLLLFFTVNFAAKAEFVVSLCFDYQQQNFCYTDVEVAQDGSVDIGATANASAAQVVVQNQVQQAIAGVQLQQESFSSAQQQIAQRIGNTMSIDIADISINFNASSSNNSAFVQQQLTSMTRFESQLFENVFTPRVQSEYFSAPIEFNASEAGDNAALKTYHQAKSQKHQQLGINDAYRQSDYSVKMIEMRQLNKGKLPTSVLDNFTALAKGMLDDTPNAVLLAYQALMASEQFQMGFASSVANNVNPLSFAFPIEANCPTDLCTAGEVAGDITSALIGGYEFVAGIGLTVGSSGLTVTVAATGTVFALPVTASGVAAGVAMAGHGLTTLNQSIKSLYSKIQTAKNIAFAKHSKSLLAKLDKQQLKQLKKQSREAGIDLSLYSEKHGVRPSLVLLDEKVQNALKKWGKKAGGKHQLYDHSFGIGRNRLTSIEKRAGLDAGELSNVYSTDAEKVTNSLDKLTQLAESVINNPQALSKQFGEKKVFWQAGKIKEKNGIKVITFKDKIQTVMPTPQKDALKP
jgi:hypothetical protein